MSSQPLVLASQSPRRRELLQLLGLPFETTVADVTEEPLVNEMPADLVARLSRAKAASAAHPERPESLVVACDTIVALEKEPDGARILGKPQGQEEATQMLRLLRGRPHHVYSAVTILDGTGRTTTELARTQLRMRAYTENELVAYVAGGDPLDKAGGYAIQHRGFQPVKEIRGCYANVMGLPLCHLTRCLQTWERAPKVDVPTACQSHTGFRCTVYREILDP